MMPMNLPRRFAGQNEYDESSSCQSLKGVRCKLTRAYNMQASLPRREAQRGNGSSLFTKQRCKRHHNAAIRLILIFALVNITYATDKPLTKENKPILFIREVGKIYIRGKYNTKAIEARGPSKPDPRKYEDERNFPFGYCDDGSPNENFGVGVYLEETRNGEPVLVKMDLHKLCNITITHICFWWRYVGAPNPDSPAGYTDCCSRCVQSKADLTNKHWGLTARGVYFDKDAKEFKYVSVRIEQQQEYILVSTTNALYTDTNDTHRYSPNALMQNKATRPYPTLHVMDESGRIKDTEKPLTVGDILNNDLFKLDNGAGYPYNMGPLFQYLICKSPLGGKKFTCQEHILGAAKIIGHPRCKTIYVKKGRFERIQFDIQQASHAERVELERDPTFMTNFWNLEVGKPKKDEKLTDYETQYADKDTVDSKDIKWYRKRNKGFRADMDDEKQSSDQPGEMSYD